MISIHYISALTRYLFSVHYVKFPPSDYWYCSLLNFFALTSVTCSTYFVLSMTFERFYSIILPHKAASFNTVRKAQITITCVIMLNILFHIPHLFISDSNGRFCIANRISAVNVYGAIYYWLSLVVSFAFPFVSLLIMNSFIIHTLRQRSKMDLTRSDNQGQNEGQHTKSESSETQIFILLLLVTFAFLLLTTPAYVLIFYMSYYHGNTPQFHAGYHFLHHFGEKTFFTNNGINFFLYVMSGQKFRNDLVKLFKCVSFKKTHNTLSSLSSFKTVDSSVSKTDDNYVESHQRIS